MIPRIQERLLGVIIDQQDGCRCIRQWDEKSALFYCDPPYVGAEGFYDEKHSHEKLAETLNTAKGRVVLSYYDCAEVRGLYRGWKRKRIETRTTICGVNVDRAKTKRVELVLWNR